MTESITREQFIAQMRTWVGVPWHHQQHSRFGCDCVGLFVGCFLELGRDYTQVNLKCRSRWPQGRRLLDRVEEICGQPIDEPEPVCLLVFWGNPNTRIAQHVACLSERNTIIHAQVGDGVKEVDYTEALRLQTLAVYRLPLALG